MLLLLARWPRKNEISEALLMHFSAVQCNEIGIAVVVVFIVIGILKEFIKGAAG